MQKALIKQTIWEDFINQFIQNIRHILSSSFRKCQQKTETENEHFQFLLSNFSLIQIKNRISISEKKKTEPILDEKWV